MQPARHARRGGARGGMRAPPLRRPLQMLLAVPLALLMGAKAAGGATRTSLLSSLDERLPASATGAGGAAFLPHPELRLAAPWAQGAFGGSREVLEAALRPGALPATARAYAGFQFGRWAGALGDGRAATLGLRVAAPSAWGWWRAEASLKGIGPTSFARGGDGRLTLRAAVREMLGSEHLAALGVPTQRVAALATYTAPAVVRDAATRGDWRAETGATLLRLAPSWLRVGSVELAAFGPAATGGGSYPPPLLDAHERVATVVTEALAAIYPNDLRGVVRRYGGGDGGDVWAQRGAAGAALLARFAERTGVLVAAWDAVRFCHGVLNTDNFALAGVAIDVVPFRFVRAEEGADAPCHDTDTDGLYTLARQRETGGEAVARLARALQAGAACNASVASDARARFERGYEAERATRAALPSPRLTLRAWAAAAAADLAEEGAAASLDGLSFKAATTPLGGGVRLARTPDATLDARHEAAWPGTKAPSPAAESGSGDGFAAAAALLRALASPWEELAGAGGDTESPSAAALLRAAYADEPPPAAWLEAERLTCSS